MKNPWTRLQSDPKFENGWLRIREDHLQRAGYPAKVQGVVTFKQLRVATIAVTSDEDCFLVGQFRYAVGLHCWELPQGTGPRDTPAIESAQRSLKVETGISAGRWTLLGELHASPALTDDLGCIFLAQDLTFGDAANPDADIVQIRRLPLENAFQMAISGEISEALSVAGLARAYHHIKYGRSQRPLGSR